MEPCVKCSPKTTHLSLQTLPLGQQVSYKTIIFVLSNGKPSDFNPQIAMFGTLHSLSECLLKE